MGHLQSTVMIGSKKEFVLIRSIDYGGKHLTQALTADGALEANAAQLLMREGDAGIADICRGSLNRLATEVRNSIGFFEGQREESHPSNFRFRRIGPHRDHPANAER